jgi:hypothetical protein
VQFSLRSGEEPVKNGQHEDKICVINERMQKLNIVIKDSIHEKKIIENKNTIQKSQIQYEVKHRMTRL